MFVSLPVPLVVGLLFLARRVMVVMGIPAGVNVMGASSRTQTETDKRNSDDAIGDQTRGTHEQNPTVQTVRRPYSKQVTGVDWIDD